MKYFNIQEFMCKCGCTMPQSVKENIEALVDNVLDPAREVFGAPVNVSSGHRCKLRNAQVGGVPNSQHQGLNGAAAADLVTGIPAGNLRLAKIIAQQNHFDQLILYVNPGGTEPQFIHVSYKRDGANRHLILKKMLGRDGYSIVPSL